MSYFQSLPVVGLFLAASLFGCASEPDPSVESVDPLVTAAEVEEAVWAFHAADTALDAQAVVDALWPEFYMFSDGKREAYPGVAAGTHEFIAGLETFATDWYDLRVIVLDADHAVASFSFRDSIVTKDGQVTQAHGPATLVWERRDGKWGVLYADADHYPAGSDE